MITRQRLHELVDRLSDAEIEDLTRLISSRRGNEEDAEHREMAELPEAWRRLDDGSPVPNWVGLIEEVRAGR